MTYAETILPEFDQEMASTRKVLEKVPDDKFDWKPHPKSHTIGWNANHLANLVSWAVSTLTTSGLDVAPVGGEPYKLPNFDTPAEILELFDQNVIAARKAIAEVKEEDLSRTWTLSRAGNPILSKPRSALVRTMVLNHMIHHRGILCVYLRLNDIPVPGMYGPSGDE